MSVQLVPLMISGGSSPVIAAIALACRIPWRICVRGACRASPCGLTILYIIYLTRAQWIYAGMTLVLDVTFIVCGYWLWPTLAMCIKPGEQSKPESGKGK